MYVFKFGGASVKDANAIKNVANIIHKHIKQKHQLLVVVSAMGKTTNALEIIVDHIDDKKPYEKEWDIVFQYHYQIINQLKLNHGLLDYLDQIKVNIDLLANKQQEKNFLYDQIVSYGEYLSTKIISTYLHQQNINNTWLDAKYYIKTNSCFTDAKVNWEETKLTITPTIFKNNSIVITQGFIGGNETAQITTLGREGSDFSAAIFAHCLQVNSLTIWKDVPGVLNADPKWISTAQKLPKISYKEAIELSYYGASIIHPKTIKPIQNSGIQLHVKSFDDSEANGTVIGNFTIEDKDLIPNYIRKQNQTLISVSPKDFSFIAEDNLSFIYGILSDLNIKVNLIQMSAISFSFCIDFNKYKLEKLIFNLSNDYILKYNNHVSLYTVRHYKNQENLLKIKNEHNEILIEQTSRETTRIVAK